MLYVLPIRLFINYEPYQYTTLSNLIFNNFVLGNDSGHLWYLATLFNIFIIFNLFERIIRKLPNTVNVIILLIFNVGSYGLPSLLNLNNTFRYAIYFYIGYLIKEKYEIKDKDNRFQKEIIILFLLQFIGNFFVIENGNFIFTALSLFFSAVSSISSVLFYYILFSILNNIYDGLHENKYINIIDNYGFSIYLFHSPIIYIILYFLSDKTINPGIMVAINFIICLTGSIIISKLLQKNKIMSSILSLQYKQKVKVNKI